MRIIFKINLIKHKINKSIIKMEVEQPNKNEIKSSHNKNENNENKNSEKKESSNIQNVSLVSMKNLFLYLSKIVFKEKTKDR